MNYDVQSHTPLILWLCHLRLSQVQIPHLTTALWLPLRRSTLSQKRWPSMPVRRRRNQPQRSLQTRKEFDGIQTSPPPMRLRRTGNKTPRQLLYFNKKNMPPKNVRGVPIVVRGTETNWSIGLSPYTNYMPSIHTLSLNALVQGSLLTNQRGLFFKIQTNKSPPAFQN